MPEPRHLNFISILLEENLNMSSICWQKADRQKTSVFWYSSSRILLLILPQSMELQNGFLQDEFSLKKSAASFPLINHDVGGRVTPAL